MPYFAWTGTFIGLVLLLDSACARSRNWHAKELAIRRGRTRTAKFTLRPHRSDAKLWIGECQRSPRPQPRSARSK